jgi:hypothetical protein
VPMEASVLRTTVRIGYLDMSSRGKLLLEMDWLNLARA